MPIQFECEQEFLTRLSIDTNEILLDITIHDDNTEETLSIMIHHENAEILINEIRKRVNQIRKKLNEK
jgi:hypothetical protein